jgi:hypothetical protein
MNWKLIFTLSLFGLVMALCTITLIPPGIEPALWLFLFVAVGRLIARFAAGDYFAHGFLVSMVNSVWITTAHVIFFVPYLVHHPQMVEMSKKIPFLTHHTRWQMLIMGPIFGVLFGLIQGLFAVLASKINRAPARS